MNYWAIFKKGIFEMRTREFPSKMVFLGRKCVILGRKVLFLERKYVTLGRKVLFLGWKYMILG